MSRRPDLSLQQSVTRIVGDVSRAKVGDFQLSKPRPLAKTAASPSAAPAAINASAIAALA